DADADADHDADHDAGADHGVEADHGSTAEAAAALHASGGDRRLWLPFLSLRFWTFFLAFFGLTGTVLSGFGLMAVIPTLLTALAVGGGSGTCISYAVHALKQHQVGVATGPQDFLGREATVVVRLGPGRAGKIRLSVHDNVIELLAEAEQEIGRGEKVLIYEMAGPVARVERALNEPAEKPAGLLPRA
ncbi:MAG: hypothetical protein FJ125_04295, partial [Deltaproteobacteria bacterium]|nr:hypothetical protein [Deltaproteobacteria bacterium]